MGLPGHLIGPHDRWNAKGHYEDECWHYLNRVAVHHSGLGQMLEPETTQIYPRIAESHENGLWDIYAEHVEAHRAPLWGMKCIMLGVIWDSVRPIIPGEKRLIMVHRKWSSIVESRAIKMQIHLGGNRQSAEQVTAALYERIYHNMVRPCVPLLHVQYEDILEDPAGQAERIIRFAGGDVYEDLDVAAAIRFVNPRLQHYA